MNDGYFEPLPLSEKALEATNFIAKIILTDWTGEFSAHHHGAQEGGLQCYSFQVSMLVPTPVASIL
ncbi:hypothetical protein [Acidovorax temperans]|uniref:hypothetical protein n=1 Tax=Acidovorax temperans TaxID=80878 RepID=UPI0012EECFE9|nr:hypothetical protein [Acidovorax temperans]